MSLILCLLHFIWELSEAAQGETFKLPMFVFPLIDEINLSEV